MKERIYNFSAGPAVMPVSVLEEARDNLLCLGDTGVGIMEHSHRGKPFIAICEEAEANCRKVAHISDDYAVLFVQGGATSQFFTVPANFLSKDQTADYIVTGSWSQKAVKEAQLYGNVHEAASSQDRNFCYIPQEINYSAAPRYVHFTSNNTIFGTQFPQEPDAPAPLVCDASSDIFSRPLDLSKYGLIYAGAQKNLGPAGVTLLIIRKDFMEQANKELPQMLQYGQIASKDSMLNTPPTFGVYVMGLVFKWILEQGGLTEIETRNKAKARILYDYLDQSALFKPTADIDSRSMMNVTFVTGNDETDATFVSEAKAAGFDSLKGHRSVGGMRASIYNAFPVEGVQALVEFMKDFEAKHG